MPSPPSSSPCTDASSRSPRRRHARGADRLDRPVRGEQPALHVARAAAEHRAVAAMAPLNGSPDHACTVAGRHDVDVAVEHQRRAAPSPARATGRPAPTPRAVDLHAGEIGLAVDVVEIDLPVVDLETALVEQASHVGLTRVLVRGAADARDPDQRVQLLQHRPLHRIDLVEDRRQRLHAHARRDPCRIIGRGPSTGMPVMCAWLDSGSKLPEPDRQEHVGVRPRRARWATRMPGLGLAPAVDHRDDAGQRSGS